MSLAGKFGYKETEVGWIPDDWRCEHLGGHISMLTGAPFKSELFSSSEGVPLIRIRDLLRGFSETGYVGEYDERYIVNTGDVLVGMDGEFHVVRWKGSRALLNQRVLKISHRPGISDLGFLFFLVAAAIGKIQDGISATTVKHLSTKDLQNLMAALPPLPEQQKIAAILSTVDDKLDVIARQIEATQTLKQGLMQTLFSRGVGTQDAVGRWVPHAEFKDSELGEIPVGWECLRLGDVLVEKPEYGANASAVPFNAENRVRYLRITDIDEHGRLRSDSIKAIPSAEAKDYILADGDLLIARSGNTVGKSILYTSAMGLCAFAGYLLRFRFGRKVLVEFVAEYLTSQFYWAWVKSSVKVGAQPNINAQQYQAMFIPVPPLDEQQRIAAVLASLASKIDLLRTRQTQFQKLKLGLMQKLLTGEWRVNVDPSATGT